MLVWGNGPIIPAYPYLAVRRSTRRYGNNKALRGWFTIRVPRWVISSVLEAQALIERMVAEGRAPTLDELANMLFVSRSHLCSAFSHEQDRASAITPGRVAWSAQNHARRVLLRCAGCNTPRLERCSTFSQAFKQSTGVSPIEWRNSNSQ